MSSTALKLLWLAARLSGDDAALCREASDLIEQLFSDLERCRCEELEEALWLIAQWADAYPTDVFHEPTREESNLAHTALKAHGLSIDIFSASMGRHCLKGIGDIAHNALEK